jgi:hypothetical protein
MENIVNISPRAMTTVIAKNFLLDRRLPTVVVESFIANYAAVK